MLSVGFRIAGSGSDEAAHRVVARAQEYSGGVLTPAAVDATMYDMRVMSEALAAARTDEPSGEIDVIVRAAVEAASSDTGGHDVYDQFGLLRRNKHGIDETERLAHDFIWREAIATHADAFEQPVLAALKMLRESDVEGVIAKCDQNILQKDFANHVAELRQSHIVKKIHDFGASFVEVPQEESDRLLSTLQADHELQRSSWLATAGDFLEKLSPHIVDRAADIAVRLTEEKFIGTALAGLGRGFGAFSATRRGKLFEKGTALTDPLSRAQAFYGFGCAYEHLPAEQSAIVDFEMHTRIDAICSEVFPEVPAIEPVVDQAEAPSDLDPGDFWSGFKLEKLLPKMNRPAEASVVRNRVAKQDQLSSEQESSGWLLAGYVHALPHRDEEKTEAFFTAFQKLQHPQAIALVAEALGSVFAALTESRRTVVIAKTLALSDNTAFGRALRGLGAAFGCIGAEDAAKLVEKSSRIGYGDWAGQRMAQCGLGRAFTLLADRQQELCMRQFHMLYKSEIYQVAASYGGAIAVMSNATKRHFLAALHSHGASYVNTAIGSLRASYCDNRLNVAAGGLKTQLTAVKKARAAYLAKAASEPFFHEIDTRLRARNDARAQALLEQQGGMSLGEAFAQTVADADIGRRTLAEIRELGLYFHHDLQADMTRVHGDNALIRSSVLKLEQRLDKAETATERIEKKIDNVTILLQQLLERPLAPV